MTTVFFGKEFRNSIIENKKTHSIKPLINMCVCVCVCVRMKERGELHVCFTVRKFEAVREAVTREKLTPEHTTLVSKAQKSINRTQPRPNKTLPSARTFNCKINSCSSTNIRSTKAFPHFLENVNQDQVILSVVIIASPRISNEEKR